MPGSGNTRVAIALRERLVSSDHNRLQALLSRDIAEVFRALFEAKTSDIESDGFDQYVTTVQAPTRAIILQGIRFNPSIGGASASVIGGVALMVDPDSSPSADDSVLKWVVDPGIGSTLSLTPGAGSTRIDIVECQRADTLLETQARDVFSTTTGTFAPANVQKVLAGRLTYRIRTGTPGSGYPGAQSGWLPIAVVAVPAAATQWTQCRIWDVRPLAVDRQNTPFSSALNLPRGGRRLITGKNSGGKVTVFGFAESTVFAGSRNGGGALPTAGIDTDTVGTAFHAPGFAHNTHPSYFYAVFPFGLPRWAELDYSTMRPGPFKGIPCISKNGPQDQSGAPSASIGIPSGLGLGTASNPDVALLFAIPADSGGTTHDEFLVDGHITYVNTAAISLAPASTSSNDSADYHFIDGTHYPANARAVYINFFVELTSAGAANNVNIHNNVTVFDDGGSNTLIGSAALEPPQLQLTFSAGAEVFTNAYTVRVPLFPTYTWGLGSAPFTRTIRHIFSSAGAHTASNHSAAVVGWELDP